MAETTKFIDAAGLQHFKSNQDGRFKSGGTVSRRNVIKILTLRRAEKFLSVNLRSGKIYINIDTDRNIAGAARRWYKSAVQFPPLTVQSTTRTEIP